jgi:hypothetical protein
VSRRVHLTGSASPECDPDLLDWANEALRVFLADHLRTGGRLIAQVGAEPRHPESGSPRTFDWLAMEATLNSLRAGDADPRPEGHLLILRGSQRGYSQVPADRQPMLDELIGRGAVELSLLPDTWRSGALIRQSQAEPGDVLLIVSGGAGVEHLADLYAQRGRPVIPWHLDLGSAGGDGVIGGIGLARKALTDAGRFFRLNSGSSSEARLIQLRVDPPGLGSAAERGSGLAQLVHDLELPHAFCVRLLNPKIERYVEVDDYFREVVKPVLGELGYRVIDLGVEPQEAAWMNEEVFTRLHCSALLFCDLTTQRPNCYTELGYGLGNGQRFLLSAHKNESLPFDTDKLPCLYWSESEAVDERRGKLRDHVARFGDMPPLVERASLL